MKSLFNTKLFKFVMLVWFSVGIGSTLSFYGLTVFASYLIAFMISALIVHGIYKIGVRAVVQQK